MVLDAHTSNESNGLTAYIYNDDETGGSDSRIQTSSSVKRLDSAGRKLLSPSLATPNLDQISPFIDQ